jgi:riboflavin synthase
MFTGLIETTGTIVAVERKDGANLIALKPVNASFTAPVGASIAVDGACLTVESVKGSVLSFTAVRETLDRTTLGRVRPGGLVNLERPLAANGRFDGHLVLGHVDGVGAVSAVRTDGNDRRYAIKVPETLVRFMAEKGSVAVDGISLTIAEVHGLEITVALIPATCAVTTMGRKRSGDAVNIECDVIARYVYRLLASDKGGEDAAAGRETTLLQRMEEAGL